MNARIRLTILLVGLSAIMAFIPNQDAEFKIGPTQLANWAQGDIYVSADQAARYVNNEDSTIQFVDLRPRTEFLECHIPGAINIPFAEMTEKQWQPYLSQTGLTTIFYANDSQTASYAWMVATGLGCGKCSILKGGMNEWYHTVMLSEFSGEKITARENALFENRFKARKLFTQLNSLPDSLKLKFMENKKLKEAQLDGGCE